MDYYQRSCPDPETLDAISSASEGLLFGEIRQRDKVICIVLTLITLAMLLACLIFGLTQPKPMLNLFFTLTIATFCVSELILIFWYRRGELDPKFRYLICYNAICIIFMCICCLMFIAKETEQTKLN